MVATSPVSKKPSSSRMSPPSPLKYSPTTNGPAHLQPAERRRRRAAGGSPSSSVSFSSTPAGGRPCFSLYCSCSLARPSPRPRASAWRACRAARSRSCPRRGRRRRRSRRGRRAPAPPAPPSRRSPPASASSACAPVGAQVLQQHLPDRRHGGREGDASRSPAARGPRRRPASGPASPAWQPTAGHEKARPQALAWNIGTTGSTMSRHRQAHHVGLQRDQRVQEVGAVRVEHALGIAGGAGGVAEAAGGVLVEAAPDAVRAVLPRSGSRSRARRRRPTLGHVALVGHDDDVLDLRHARRGARSGSAGRCRSVKRILILGVVDDVAELVGEQPRVQRVADRADAHDRVPGLDVAAGVPGQRRRRGRPA